MRELSMRKSSARERELSMRERAILSMRQRAKHERELSMRERAKRVRERA